MNDITTSIELPQPWYWTDQDLTDQLKKEISKTHALYAKTVRTLARRQDNDDALFYFDNDQFAVVHLTWTRKRHSDDRWPTTELFDNWDDLFHRRILKDKEEFE
jgi:hypothetical protein